MLQSGGLAQAVSGEVQGEALSTSKRKKPLAISGRAATRNLKQGFFEGYQIWVQ
jgi:hypothetical protein